MHQVVVPFKGFYTTGHEGILDAAFNDLIQSDSGDPIESLQDIYDQVPWKAVFNAYARWYVETLVHKFPALKAAGLTFGEVESPREYNFTNDLIIGSVADPEGLRTYCDEPTLRELVKKAFTPYDGFIPFFSSDLDDDKWARPVTEWEPIQLRFLLEAAMRSDPDWDEDDMDPWSLAEDARGNSVFENMIWALLPEDATKRIQETQRGC